MQHAPLRGGGRDGVAAPNMESQDGMVSAEDGDTVRRLLQNQEGDEGKTPDPV